LCATWVGAVAQIADSAAVAGLLDESSGLMNGNPEVAILKLNEALSRSEKSKNAFLISRVHRRFGYYYRFTGNLAQSEKHYRTVLKIHSKNYLSNNTAIKAMALKEIADALNGIALKHKINYESKKAIQYYAYAEIFYIAQSDHKALAYLYSNRGATYVDISDYPNAIKGFYAALKTAEQENDSVLIQNNYGNLGNSYYNLGDLKKAKHFVSLSLRFAESRKDSLMLFVAYNAYAKILYDDDQKYSLNDSNINEAINYYKKAETIAKALRQDGFRAFNFSNLASLYLLTETTDSIIKYFEISNALAKEMGEKQTIAINNFDLGIFFYERNNYDKAEKLFLNGIERAKAAELNELLMNMKKIYSELLEKRGDSKKSLEQFKEYVVLRDSIFNQENTRKTLQQQLKYEYEKKAAADSVKSAEEKKVVAAQLKQEKTQRFALYGGLSLVGLFALFMVNRFRVTNQQKKLIEEQKQIVEAQKHLVEEKQKEILDSIHYAKRIQTALITSEFYIGKCILRLKE
jgi:tetratricopeptide (TPR) repeat protein